MANLDFEKINSAALNCLEELLREWLPAGHRSGNEYICGDWNGTKGESLSINIKTGKGGDFASGDYAGDPIGICGKVFKLEYVEAAKKLATMLAVGESTPNKLAMETPSEDTTDEERQAKIDKIISESIPVKGTPAQIYLQSRGLNGCHNGLFKFRPRRTGNGGSLICIAKNDKGEIKAVQSVYLTAEGKKADIKVKKRTNGFPSGNPIKIPERITGGPILICEGPEDALTLSQATGFETWCTMGIAFMEKVQLPEDKQIIIVRDNDEVDSEADKKMCKIIASFIDRGCKNLLCARAPEGVKDANQLLQSQGEKAIVDMINNAMPIKDARNYPTEIPYTEEIAEDTYNQENPIFEDCAFFHHTDVGNADRIKRRWSNIVKFVPNIGWLIYDHGHWNAELADLRVIKMAKLTAVEIKKELPFVDEHIKDSVRKWAKKSQSGLAIKNAIRLAQPELALSHKELDKNHFYFNVANGVIDLQTGQLLPHRPDYFLTKQSSIMFDPEAKCPTWLKFLKEIFPGHEEIIPFIQRAVGYSLTGDTREQCMFILHGGGSNGKSTFLDTLQGVIGDYWVKTKSDAFMEKERGASDANPFLTMLRGARFVTASETRSDRSLDESLVKEASGDSFMTVRSLHQNPITFMPQFKLWLATNHKPEIRGTDDGIWRRLKLIPFHAKFYDTDDENAPEHGPFKDKLLMSKLKAELPGILNWAIQGCMHWLKDGLNPPQIIRDATNEYRDDMDVIGSYIDECCNRGITQVESCTRIYNSYKNWAAENGHGLLSKNKFGRRLYERGYEKGRTVNGEKAYTGISLKNPGIISSDFIRSY